MNRLLIMEQRYVLKRACFIKIPSVLLAASRLQRIEKGNVKAWLASFDRFAISTGISV